MNFELEKSIELLARTPRAYKALFYGLSSDWAVLNEGEDTWSAYDIIGHLIHGEKTDWMPRAKLILNSHSGIKTFEAFDRFAQKENSAGKRMDELLDEFESLREQNLSELQSWNLNEDQLAMRGKHPDLGEVDLKQLLSCWTIHDIGHLHQVSRVMVKHYADDVGPWSAYSRILSADI